MSNPSETITVWIVEDDARYRETLVLLLEHTSDLVCGATFGDCEEILDYLEAGSLAERTFVEPPDVILLDINLPGAMNGIETINPIKSILPTTHIVMLTILDDDDTIFDALRAGASGYLLKNSPLDKILAAIREASQGGTLLPASVASKVLRYFTESAPKTDYGLTDREQEVLAVMAEGLTQKAIAGRLFVSPHTVNTHIQHIYEKLHVRSGIEAVAKALRERLI